MAKINVLYGDQDGNAYFKEFEGEIYKGIGIVHWLSAGKQIPWAIDLQTGRIKVEFCDRDLIEVKRLIDSSL